MRVDRDEYERIELRAHSLLADVPLHDVWAVELPGSERGCTIGELRAGLSMERVGDTNPAVKLLFGLRALLGRLFGWDREPAESRQESFRHRLSEAECAASLVAPGTQEGPFKVLFVSEREAISEVRNATVHAFSVFALVEVTGGSRLYWAIYVLPVSPWTEWYMRLIDPFRRYVIYPAVLRRIRRVWESRGNAAGS